jgi:peptide/nickel transport system substrate-binding protein
MMKRNALTILAAMLVAVLVFAACGAGAAPGGDAAAPPAAPVAPPPVGDTPAAPPQVDAPQATAETELIVLVPSLAVSMDPIQSNDSASALVNNMIYSTLVNQNVDDLSIYPGLAINWNLPNAATINMELRRGVTFHNGDPLTARDVEFSINRGAASPHVEPILGMISHVVVHDDYNFTIHLEMPFAPIMAHLAHPAAGIVPMNHLNSVGEDAFADSPVGSGPFMFTNHVLGDRIETVANQNYWGNVPVIEDLIFRLVPDPSGRLISVETGDAMLHSNLLRLISLLQQRPLM